MTATLEQTQADLPNLVGMVQRGDEVIITSQGRPVAPLTSLPQPKAPADRQAWVTELAGLRQRFATGKIGVTVEQILDEDRGN